MNKPIVFLVFLMMVCVTVFSCAHGSKMRKLYPGMTKQEVLKALGKPDGYQKVRPRQISPKNRHFFGRSLARRRQKISGFCRSAGAL